MVPKPSVNVQAQCAGLIEYASAFTDVQILPPLKAYDYPLIRFGIVSQCVGPP